MNCAQPTWLMNPCEACIAVSSPPFSKKMTGPDSCMLGFWTTNLASSSSVATQEAQSDAPASKAADWLRGVA